MGVTQKQNTIIVIHCHTKESSWFPMEKKEKRMSINCINYYVLLQLVVVVVVVVVVGSGNEGQI